MQFNKKIKIFVSAGELSGDQIGYEIIKEFKKITNIKLYGIGGKNLKKIGLESIFPINNISLMGLLEVLPKIPKLFSLIRLTVNKILSVNPDLIITIDSPDFNFRVLKKLKKINNGLKVLHIVAPTVWAWKPNRAKKISEYIDYLFVLYPFEKKYFVAHGIKTFFIGHPLLEKKNMNIKSLSHNKYSLFNNQKKIVSIFPGSRKKEIILHLSKIMSAIEDSNYKDNINIAILAVDEYIDLIRSIVSAFENNLSLKVFKNSNKIKLFKNTYAAIAVSGTITLELAIHRVPFLTVYKLNPISYFILKNIVTTKYITIVNIIYNKRIVYELIQDDFNLNNLKHNLSLFLKDKKLINSQRKYFNKLTKVLLYNYKNPSSYAAKLIKKII